MSFWAQRWAYEQEAKNSGERFVLVVLADFADAEGFCFPGQAKIAAMTCLDKRTISRHLAKWRTRGIIRRRARFRADGTRTSDIYQLCAPSDRLRPPNKKARSKEDATSAEQPDRTSTNQDGRRLNSTEPPDQNCATPADKLSGDPSDPIHQGSTRERARTPTHKLKTTLKTKFPKDFEPSDEDRKFAQNLGHNPLKLFEKFRKYSISKGIVNEDWHSAFQLFVSREWGDGSEANVDRSAEWRGSGTCSHKGCDGLQTCRYVEQNMKFQSAKSIAVPPSPEEGQGQTKAAKKERYDRFGFGEDRGVKSLRSAES